MRKNNFPKDITNQRYLMKPDARIYYQLGEKTLLNLAKKANAYRKVGSRVLIDKKTLDEYLEAQKPESSESK